MNHGMYDEQELSFEQAGQDSLAGANEYLAEQACIAEKEAQEHQQYMYVLSLGE